MKKFNTEDKNLLWTYIRSAIELYEKGELPKTKILLKASEWWQNDITIKKG